MSLIPGLKNCRDFLSAKPIHLNPRSVVIKLGTIAPTDNVFIALLSVPQLLLQETFADYSLQ
jgi:hypothetical protein